MSSYDRWLKWYTFKIRVSESWLEFRYRLHWTSRRDYRHKCNRDQWEPRGYEGRK